MLLGSGQTSRWRASVWLEQVAYHCNEAVFSCKAIFSFLRIGVVTVVQVRDRFEPGSTNQDFGEPGSMKCSLGSRPCLRRSPSLRLRGRDRHGLTSSGWQGEHAAAAALAPAARGHT